MVETPEGSQPVEVRGEFTVAHPPGVPEGSPIDVALAVNLGPIPLAPGTRYRGGWPSTASRCPGPRSASPPGPATA